MSAPHWSTASHGLSRRVLLQGALAGGMAFGGFQGLFHPARAAEARSKQRRVILVFMSGGPSQFETWDPKPGQPTGGPHLTIPTRVPGLHIDEYLPKLAERADRMAVVRSMKSDLGDHMEGHFLAQTGVKPTAVVAPPPHWLTLCGKLRPADDPSLPSYVRLGAESGGPLAVPGPGFLGASFQGLHCPGNGRPPQDLPGAETAASELEAYRRRMALRGRLATGFVRGREGDAIRAHESTFAEVERLLGSSDLFDLSRESAGDLERYGRSALGRDCLLARRLVERGVPFVRVQHQGGLAWDKHRRAFESQRHISTEFDTAVGTLIDDLHDRGLWDHTLLVLMGEFGRTPEILGQGPPGRNHWTKSWSMSLGGCGIKGGVVVGSTNAKGTDIQDRPVSIPELFATFYTALGIDPHLKLDFEGRPVPLVEDEHAKPVAEVL